MNPAPPVTRTRSIKPPKVPLEVDQAYACFYDGNIMKSRTQITLDPEMQQRARKRAGQLGISFAEYIRRLVSDDLSKPNHAVDPSIVFNLGNSGCVDIAKHEDDMLGEAIVAEKARY